MPEGSAGIEVVSIQDVPEEDQITKTPPKDKEAEKTRPDGSPNEDRIQDIPQESQITKTPPREKAAEKVASKIIFIFGGAILGVLFLDFVTVWILAKAYGCDAGKFEEVITKGVVPLLAATSSLGSAVFAPLLAFVLGYYFTKKGDV